MRATLKGLPSRVLERLRSFQLRRHNITPQATRMATEPLRPFDSTEFDDMFTFRSGRIDIQPDASHLVRAEIEAVPEPVAQDFNPVAPETCVFSRRIINEKAPEYAIKREKSKETKKQAFGESELTGYRDEKELLARFDRDEIPDFPGGREGILESLSKRFFYLRYDLNSFFIASHPDRHLGEAFLDEIFLNADLCEAIRSHLGVSELSRQAMTDALTNDKLDNDIFVMVIENHIDIFNQKRAVFNDFVEATKVEFRLAAERAIAKGYLPISPERLAARIEEVSFELTDPVINNSSLGTSDLWKVSLSERVPMDERRYAVFHELTHAAVAGRSLILYQYDTLIRIELLRSGLRFEKPRQNMYSNPSPSSLVWFNEGMTEEIALYLSGEDAARVGGYSLLRAGISVRLTEKGIPEEIIRAAYCEDYNPETPRGERLTATRNLFREINTKLGRQTLNRMSRQHSFAV